MDKRQHGETGNYFTTDQFSKSLNSECHYLITGQEIIGQLHAESVSPDAFVAGVGTGGTLMGVARAPREVNPSIYIAAVEPAESAVMSGGEVEPHDIAGIGDGFVPAPVRDVEGSLSPIIEEVIQVKSGDAIEGSKRLARDLVLRGRVVGSQPRSGQEAEEAFRDCCNGLSGRFHQVRVARPRPVWEVRHSWRRVTESQGNCCWYSRLRLQGVSVAPSLASQGVDVAGIVDKPDLGMLATFFPRLRWEA